MFYPEFMKRALLITAGLFIVGCTSVAPVLSDGPDRVSVDIGDLSQNGVSVTSITTPAGYQQGDKLVAYEGPGWESDRVAYRLYLDGRNAIDIFGKRQPGLILSTVGRGDDYHAMADWGMDILKVGNSLGAGGFGVMRDGAAVQIGDAAQYKARVVTDTTDEARVRVTHAMSETCGDDIVADYTIEAGSYLTDVRVTGTCTLPFAAGLVIHPETVRGELNTTGTWAAVYRYGEQTLVPDDLGTAIFYQPADVSRVSDDDDDSYVAFHAGVSPHYKFAAVWSQEPGAPQNAADFTRWVETTLDHLNEQDDHDR